MVINKKTKSGSRDNVQHIVFSCNAVAVQGLLFTGFVVISVSCKKAHCQCIQIIHDRVFFSVSRNLW